MLNNGFQEMTLHTHASAVALSTVDKVESISDPLGSSSVQTTSSLKVLAGKYFGVMFSSATANVMAETFPFGCFADSPVAGVTAHFAHCISGNATDALGRNF